MEDLSNSLVLYRNGVSYDVLIDFFKLVKEREKSVGVSIADRLLNLAVDYGFKYDVWQNYIALMLITSDNVFSRTSERRKACDCTIARFAKNDIQVLYELFNYDFSDIDGALNSDYFKMLKDYTGGENTNIVRFPEVSKRLEHLTDDLRRCKNSAEFFDRVCEFYEVYGYGTLGLNRSFRLDVTDQKMTLKPVVNSSVTELSDIVGYESQKQQLLANTKAFVEGKPANNVLLYGDSGTGKSTSIKAIVDTFYNDGIRMVEVYKHQIQKLPELISQLAGRNYRFIIYLDDLSFEEAETEYKYLKAVIEGGAQCKPQNVLIYATSNRRHLIKEVWQDRNDISARNDVHSADTIEEKLSLSARFGLTIYYPKPSRDEYMNIVENLAQRNNIKIDSKQLRDKARVWEMHHGGISGRTAAQFITDMLSNQ